ncbi:hypothetical protein [Dyella jiangningensis]|uniref:hypothetical protein n=1 Tax=Dyella jiangningensis TaxID=1379159 RepID=UPI0011BD5DE0|nr:hypothetical protein [Dyella jiangningensis]
MRFDETDEALRPATCGVIAVLVALFGAGLCALGWKLNIPALVLLGVIAVCASILSGIGFILWGWWKAFRTQSK